VSTQNEETVHEFRARARAWLRANVSLAANVDPHMKRGRSDESLARAKELQRLFFDGGFAGLVYPREYGGQGLSPEYARAFAEEAGSFEAPFVLQEPTQAIIAPTIFDCGTEAQKLQHLPKILRGEARWVQFLSEPSGGSDVASSITTAQRVSGGYVLNGAKIWSTGADRADWALCPARTNWDVPKYQGLTVFLPPSSSRASTSARSAHRMALDTSARSSSPKSSFQMPMSSAAWMVGGR
jgi:alkylation response protein AidB-like acyl-CoA dehydrogenase